MSIAQQRLSCANIYDTTNPEWFVADSRQNSRIGSGIVFQACDRQPAHENLHWHTSCLFSAMKSAKVQLSVRSVRKSFSGKSGQVPVLEDLSFDINESDFVSIIGPSGCGKTTIFNIIAGLIEPDSGMMIFRGEEVDSLRGRVGYMMQKDLLFPWRTVLGNVLLGLETRGVDSRKAEEKAREYLDRFGLPVSRMPIRRRSREECGSALR